MNSIYDFNVNKSNGDTITLNNYKGNVLLIVNIATRCGFTSQLNELEQLYQKYQQQGLVVIGFPCNQFAHQNPESDDETASFCQANFGVSFPIMGKVDVNGSNANPLYKFLKSKSKGLFTRSIKWNFTKFLISRDGSIIKRYAPITSPKKLEEEIINLLNNK